MTRTLTKEKRDSLIEAAIEIFREKDYGEVTVREIVARAGSSPATFYRYFKTKKDLYSEILDAWLDRYMEVWDSIDPLYGAGIDGRLNAQEATRAAVERIFAFYRDNREVAGAIFRKGASVDGRFAQRGDEVVELTVRHLAEVVRRLQEAGLVQGFEPDVLAAIMFSVVYGVAIACVVHEKRDDVENLAAQATRMLWSGIT
jgi:AcrR family transcriptional regulator